jgi:phenylacetate-coenzyme A ligase PaaK-like adenylate-forming protein
VSGALAFWMAADAAATFRAVGLDTSSTEAVARGRLSRLLFHVARNNPFYGRRFQDVGIEWADPIFQRDPYAALAALPPVSKLELRRAGERAFDGGALNPGWYSSASSGSSGEPFRVYYEPRAWARLKYLVKLRARYACGVRPTDRLTLLDANPPPRGPRPWSWGRRWTRISVLQPAAEVAAALSEFRPDVVYGLPSALVEAGRLVQLRDGRIPIRAVFTSGELLHPALRDTLANVFQAPVHDVYGTSETKEIAWQCAHGRMHLNADVVRLEAVDDFGRGVAAGIEGDLVATVLVNRAMPLLRYRTGDRGSLLSGTCACGCALPLLGVVTGRTADILVLRGGHRISPYALTSAIERVPGVLRYQVSQMDPARVRVRAIVEAAADREAVTAQVRTALRYDVASFLDVDVEFVDRLPTGPRAKFRVVEPLEPVEVS